MAQRVPSYDDCPWSEDCEGAPWWISYHAQSRMRDFAKSTLALSANSPDMAGLNNYLHQLFFVYGSLKRGFGANDLLEDAELLGRGWTSLQRFKMVVGEFPVALFEPNSDKAKAIQGELYKVPNKDIKHLDLYEGNGALFRRRRLTIKLDTGEERTAWTYLGVQTAFSALTKLAPVYTRKKTNQEYYSYTKNGRG